MSVINQMLKDLDNRQQPPTSETNPIGQVVANKSSANRLIILLLVALLLALAVIVWQLWQKSPEQSVNQVKITAQPPQSSSISETADHNLAVIDQAPLATTSSHATSPDNSQTQLPNSPPEPSKTSEHSSQLQQSKMATAVGDDVVATKLNEGSKLVEQAPSTALTQAVATKVDRDEPDKKDSAGQQTEKSDVGQLRIQTSEVAPEQLAEKKWQQAQTAMANQQGKKAEQALQDLLLLTPDKHEAREQLAALWYSRGDAVAAINVLNQGLQLYSQHWPFRLMQAKIYIKQQQAQQALTVLNAPVLPKDNEYLTLMANLAQQLGQYAAAIKSYQQLHQLAPNQGRWQLGLAIAYDSDGQFEQAKQYYSQALAAADLSANSQQFVRQRLQQLGE